MQPKVKFRKKGSDRALSDQEIEEKLAQGAVIHNTSLNIHQAKKALRAEVPPSPAESQKRHLTAHAHILSKAIEISDPNLDRSDETAIAINPRNPKNIVAGAITFDGKEFTNSAYVSMDGGNIWQTVIALKDTDEGAGIAFDDSGNCYYVTMQGGFNPRCVVSQDGGLTWSSPASFGYGDKTAVAARGQIALCGFVQNFTEGSHPISWDGSHLISS